MAPAFPDPWQEEASLDAAMPHTVDRSLTNLNAMVPSAEPTKVFIMRGGAPGVRMVYAEATVTISPTYDAGAQAGYDSWFQGAPAGTVVREFEGYPALGAEKGTTVGDPTAGGAWGIAMTTNLAWAANGYEYAFQSDTLTLSELQSLTRELFPSVTR